MKRIVLAGIGIVVLAVAVALFGIQSPQTITGVSVCATERGEPPPFRECPGWVSPTP